MEHSDRVDFTLPVDEPRRVGWIASQYVSYVHDNSLWLASGPIDGGRFSVTAGLSSDFTNSRFDSYLVIGDWRHYFRLGKESAGRSGPRLLQRGRSPAAHQHRRHGGTARVPAVRVHRRLAGLHVQPGAPVSDPHPPDPGAAVRRLGSAADSGGLFTDVGKATYSTTPGRGMLGSFGISFRMALGPLTVLRLDWGRRFGSNGPEGLRTELRPEGPRLRQLLLRL